jgi:hypothetical protein
MVEAKQYYILKPKQLVLLIRPGTSFLVEEYHPWNKDRNSYVCIKSDGNIDVRLEVLPRNLPGLVFFHNHSFPVFRNKRQATFYGHLSILLSVLQKEFSQPSFLIASNEDWYFPYIQSQLMFYWVQR